MKSGFIYSFVPFDASDMSDQGHDASQYSFLAFYKNYNEWAKESSYTVCLSFASYIIPDANFVGIWGNDASDKRC